MPYIWIGVELAPESCNISHSGGKINRLIFGIWVAKHPFVTRSHLKDEFVFVGLARGWISRSLSHSYASGRSLVGALTIDKPTPVTQTSRCRRGVDRWVPKTPDFAGGGSLTLSTGCSVFAYVNIYWNCDKYICVTHSPWLITSVQAIPVKSQTCVSF